MIARALYTLPNFNQTVVCTILTQATPHQMPVIIIDPFLADFYRRVNEHWAKSLGRDVLIISTGGGHRDVLVRNGLTSLSKVRICIRIHFWICPWICFRIHFWICPSICFRIHFCICLWICFGWCGGLYIHLYIHSGPFYSAPSSPLLLRGAPD